MTQRLKLDEEAAQAAVSRGEHARQLLEDKLFREVVAKYEEQIVGEMKSAQSPEAAWQAHLKWEAIVSVLAELKHIFTFGHTVAEALAEAATEQQQQAAGAPAPAKKARRTRTRLTTKEQ